MKTKNAITFLLVLFTAGVIYPQALTLKKANSHFEKLEFKTAAEQYERVLKKDTKSNLAIHNLAMCYFKLNDLINAEKWFAKTVQLNDVRPEEYLYYAKTLKQNNKLEESKKWFEKYSTVSGKDKRGKRFSESLAHIGDYYKDSANYSISLVKELSSGGSDFSPYFYKNGLLYVSERDHDKYSTSEFMWDQSHFLDLYFAEFDSKEIPSFKKEHPFSSKLNTKYHEGPISMNKEQTFVAFTRNNYFHKKVHLSADGVNKLKIFFNEYKDGKWLSAQNFPHNNDQFSCGHPALSSNGKIMYFVSDMPGGFGGTDIWKCNYDNGNWSKPENLGDKINSEGNEMFPTLINDSIFYFSSNGLGGIGGLDIYSTPYNNGKFGEYQNIGYPINSNHDDFGLIYDPKTESGYFSSNRPNAKGGSDDIYFFKTHGYYITIQVIDKNTTLPLPNGAINYSLLGKTFSLTTNEMGKVKLKITGEKDFDLASIYPNYADAKSSISTKGKNTNKNLEIVIPMVPMTYKLVATVTDSKTKQLISDASILFYDELNNKQIFISDKTNSEGSVSKLLKGKIKGNKIKFEISLKKEKYLSKTEYFEAILANDPIIQIPLKLLELDSIAIGTDVGKLIDIKPIYFDLDKSTIRSDAATELDKMVKVMQANPNIVIELGSHTDCRASAQYNMGLSDKRAKASASYIISKGIDKKRIFGKGYGESRLLNDCACEGTIIPSCSEEEHQLNRRTEFKIVKM